MKPGWLLDTFAFMHDRWSGGFNFVNLNGPRVLIEGVLR